jgi:hypothetical protein
MQGGMEKNHEQWPSLSEASRCGHTLAVHPDLSSLFQCPCSVAVSSPIGLTHVHIRATPCSAHHLRYDCAGNSLPANEMTPQSRSLPKELCTLLQHALWGVECRKKLMWVPFVIDETWLSSVTRIPYIHFVHHAATHQPTHRAFLCCGWWWCVTLLPVLSPVNACVKLSSVF